MATVQRKLCGVDIFIDEDDLHLIENYKWHVRTSKHKSAIIFRRTVAIPNAKRKKYTFGSDRKYERKQERSYLHKEIVGAASGERVLFADGNRANLSKSNISKHTPEVSQYIGVMTCLAYVNFKKKWIARIKDPKGKRINIGYFQTQNEAAQAYNDKATEFYGKNAVLNTIVVNDETTKKNPNWLKTHLGRYWKSLSKKEIIETIKSNTTDKNREDNEWLVKFIEGDNQAFGRLVSKYQAAYLSAIKNESNRRNALLGKFNNQVSRRVKSRNISMGEAPLDFQDIVTEGLMSVMKAIKTGRFKGINFEDWSCKIMRNKWNDYARKKYKLPDWRTRQRKKKGRDFINRNKRKHSFHPAVDDYL